MVTSNSPVRACAPTPQRLVSLFVAFLTAASRGWHARTVPLGLGVSTIGFTWNVCYALLAERQNLKPLHPPLELIMPMLPITTTPALKVAAGHVQLTAGTRATKGKIIPADQRSRSVVIPELTPQVERKFLSLVIDALYQAGEDQLRALWRESDPKESDSALWTEDSLLAFANRQAESKRLNGETITAWYEDSAIRAAMLKAGGTKRADAVLTRLQNLAAPQPSYTLEQCQSAIVLLAGDASSDMGRTLILKLQRIIERIESDRKALEVSAVPF